MFAWTVGALALSFATLGAVGQEASEPCVMDPTVAGCETFVYPEDQIVADIEMNCSQMPWMIGCGVWDACMDGTMSEDNPYCAPFTVLASSCVDQGMTGMGGCINYVSMCGTGSLVMQCQDFPPIPSVVSTDASQEAVIGSCSTHSMPGCETCTAKFTQCPNTLSSLSQVCQSMRMEVCTPFYNMCTAAGSDLDAFCSTEGGQFDPPMRMFFHTGIRDIMLFRRLVPENNGEYAGVVIATLVAGILAGGLRVLRGVWETRDRILNSAAIRQSTAAVAEQSVFALPAAEVPAHLGRSFLSLIIITLDYSLMLIAMTFNVGIFFAVVGGLALGLLFFGHITRRYTERLQAQTLLSAQRCDCSGQDEGSSKIDAAMFDSGSKALKKDGKCCDSHTADAIADAAAPLPNVQADCCSSGV